MKPKKVERRQDRQLRICLTGGSDITEENDNFCRILGARIAQKKWITIINGGLKRFRDRPKKICADYSYVQGALSQLGEDKEASQLQIMTLLPGRDMQNVERFRKGTTIDLKNHSQQSRRFAMVRYSDLIVTVQGAKGIKGIVDLAIAFDKPILPLPFTGGASEEAWKTHKKDIKSLFEITDETERFIESIDLKSANRQYIEDIACRIVDLLLQPAFVNQSPKKCAVIMPISKTRTCSEKQWDQIFRIIKKCIESLSYNYECVRCSAQYGETLIVSILGKLDDADIVIADLTDKNPNVLYELGYRHGRKPNTIMITQRLKDVPFDLRHRNIIIYGWTTDDERNKLCRELSDILKWIENGGQIKPPGKDELSN